MFEFFQNVYKNKDPGLLQHNSAHRAKKTRRGTRGGQRRSRRIKVIIRQRNTYNNITHVRHCTNSLINNNIQKSKNEFKPTLPSIVIGNVRSINNKIEELTSYVRYDDKFKSCSLLCFTETWLRPEINDNIVSIENFNIFRNDRDLNKSGKTGGGGVCAYVNTLWCNPNNVHVKLKYCDENIELLTLSIRPFYLPREFSHVIVSTVYIPPSAKYACAAEILGNHISDIQTDSPDAFIIVTGDFNQCPTKRLIPGLHQLVTTSTRGLNTLDLFFSNVKNSHQCKKLPPLGRSDHSLIYLHTDYTPLVKRNPPKKITVQTWTTTAKESLQDCFDTTDWDIFINSADDVTELTDTTCSYIDFCIQQTIPTKTITLYSNNKPWVTKELKHVINKKKLAFKNNNSEDKKAVQKKLKFVIKKGKEDYKKKIEKHFEKNNMKSVWEGLNLMSGCKRKKETNNDSIGTVEYANNLNQFYSRFDCHDFRLEHDVRKKELDEKRTDETVKVVIEDNQVLETLKNLKRNKAPGPDGINSNVLKFCAYELYHIFCVIFNMSLAQCCIPPIWKTSVIVPVPKKTKITCMNDLRPVALTSCIMKVFEKCVLNHLKTLLCNVIDPLQFAYRVNRSTDDALLHILNRITSHLENKNSCVRLMFFDFSSAFNTIQPHLLCDKLKMYNIPASIISWLLNYLTDRPQLVRLDPYTFSDSITTFTGAPQGTVLSPFLFSIYTSDCKPNQDSCTMVKYADDTVLTGLIKENNFEEYVQEVNTFVDWCKNNFLILNVEKTKEMVIDFRKHKTTIPEIHINDKVVERVESFKYLGVVVDNELSWKGNAENVIKKLKPRIYCLRKLKTFHIDSKLLQMFYTSMVSSVITYGICCWGGNACEQDKDMINKIIKKSSKIIGKQQNYIDTLLQQRDTAKMRCIIQDITHPLYDEYDKRLIHRSGRHRVPIAKTNRYSRSFIPRSISSMNKIHQRKFL